MELRSMYVLKYIHDNMSVLKTLSNLKKKIAFPIQTPLKKNVKTFRNCQSTKHIFRNIYSWKFINSIRYFCYAGFTMAFLKERRQKNVKFGLSKDDNFEVESNFPHDEGSAFNSARDYWQHMTAGSPERKHESLLCKYFILYILWWCLFCLFTCLHLYITHLMFGNGTKLVLLRSPRK